MFANATILQQTINNGLINTTNTVNWSGGNGGAGSSADIIPQLEEGAVDTTPQQQASYIASVPPRAPLPPPPPPPNTTVQPASTNILKLSPTNGQTIWGVDISGTTTTLSVSTDGTNVYSLGIFNNPNCQIINSNNTVFTTLTSSYTYNNYIVKYNLQGIAQWAAKITDTLGTSLNLATVITDGVNAYVIGYYTSSLNIYDSDGILYNTSVPINGSQQTYIVKYDPNGKILWVSFIYSANGPLVINSAAYGPSGLYLAGYFFITQKVTLYNPGVVDSTISVKSIPSANPGSNTGIVCKYNTNGIAQWATVVGNAEPSGVKNTGIAVDSNDNIYVIGQYKLYAAAYSANNQLAPVVSLSGGILTIYGYIIKYNSSGSVLWGCRMATIKNTNGAVCIPTNIVLDNTGIYVTGYFNLSDLRFYNRLNGSIGPLSYIDAGSYTTFLVKYDFAGIALWATQVINNSDNNVVSTDIITGNGNVYISGYFQASVATPYNTPLGTVSTSLYLLNTENYNNFVVAYNTNGIAQWVLNPSLPSTNTGLITPLIYADTLYMSFTSS